MRTRAPLIIAALVGLVLVVGIRLISTHRGGGGDDGAAFHHRTGCTTVVVAASSEKALLLAKIANDYARADRKVNGRCFDIKVDTVASGTAEAALAQGWDTAVNGERPDVWTPAASTWVGLLRQDLSKHDQPITVPDQTPSIANTPLVLAMPKPMAQALGWPDKPIGWADVLHLADDPQGWASKGHPEWGAFKLGKTNPEISTSGLAATVGAFVAATGRSSDLSAADVANPTVRDFVQRVERSVVHYGDTTLTYLTNLQRADDSGTAMSYVSAVAVEEKSVLDYDAGNPSGDPATLGKHHAPKVPLVAVYPSEGTLYSDSPWVSLDAPWTTSVTKAGAADFLKYLLSKPAQQRFTAAGFRTANRTPGQKIKESSSVAADGVKITLDPPGPAVLAQLRDAWTDLRKPARVLLLVDESGSMSEPVPGTGSDRMDLAKASISRAVKDFGPNDEVGLWAFTTDLPSNGGITQELAPIAPVGQNAATIDKAVAALQPLGGTPLYQSIDAAVKAMSASYDPQRINAVVVLTDGRNEYSGGISVENLKRALSDGGDHPIRVFSVAYSGGADVDTLRSISEASRAASYDATDAAKIDSVLTAVVSNF